VGNHRLVRSFICLLIGGFSGCQALHPATPVDVQVRDAETKAPIDGAQVRLSYAALHSATSSGTTGPDGMVRIPPPPLEDAPLQFEAAAKGYLPRQSGQTVERSPMGVVLEMYAEPRPVLELVLPTGYRGVVKVSIRVQNDLKHEPHLRVFSYPVTGSGVTTILLPPVFTRGVTPDIRTRYADGTPLLRDAKDYEIGCRWLKADPDKEYLFVIGTQWEADSIRRENKKAETGRDQLGEESITGYGRLR
jgi:hypothetical protein